MEELKRFVGCNSSGCLLFVTAQRHVAKATLGCSVREVHGSINSAVPITVGKKAPTDDLFVEFGTGQFKLRQVDEVASVGSNTCELVVSYNLSSNPWIKTPEDADTVGVAVYWDKTKPFKKASGTSLPGSNAIAYEIIVPFHVHKQALCENQPVTSTASDRYQSRLKETVKPFVAKAPGIGLWANLETTRLTLEAETKPYFQ